MTGVSHPRPHATTTTPTPRPTHSRKGLVRKCSISWRDVIIVYSVSVTSSWWTLFQWRHRTKFLLQWRHPRADVGYYTVSVTRIIAAEHHCRGPFCMLLNSVTLTYMCRAWTQSFNLSSLDIQWPRHGIKEDRMIRLGWSGVYTWWSSKWIHFPRYLLFVRGINRSAVNSPHKGQWRGKLMISLICSWINGWENNQPQHCCTWTVKTAIWFPWKFNHQSFFLKARLYVSLIYWGLEKNCHRFVDSIFKLLFLKENIPINVMKYERKTIPTTFEKRLGLKQHY